MGLNAAEVAMDLASPDQVKAYKAERALTNAVSEAGAPGKDAEREKLCDELVKALEELKPQKHQRGTPTVESLDHDRGRREVLRLLSSIAGEKQLEALEQLIHNQDVNESVCWTLTRMSCPGAVGLLARAAVEGVGLGLRTGAINGLAKRQDKEAVEALTKCTSDLNREIRLTAAEALAEHADPSADAALVAVEKKSRGRAKRRVVQARLQLAENLQKAGQKAASKKICDDVVAGDADKVQKKAAQTLLSRLSS